VPRERSRYNGSKPRKKKPAYPKVGSGEDFPAKRPGTKIGEGRSGQKRMQSTRASQARRARAAPFDRLVPPTLPTPRRGEPFRARMSPPSYTGKPSGKRQYPFSAGIRGKPTKENPWPL
jgi:hypothetical protein